MRIHTRNRDDNPFAGSSQSDKVVRSNMVVAGLGKVCEKILLVLSSILLAIFCVAMMAGVVTFLTGVTLRFIHPESEYQIQFGQIFWSWFMIGTITVILVFISANCRPKASS